MAVLCCPVSCPMLKKSRVSSSGVDLASHSPVSISPAESGLRVSLEETPVLCSGGDSFPSSVLPSVPNKRIYIFNLIHPL